VTELTTKQIQIAQAHADLERWQKDASSAQENGDEELAKKLRGWIARRRKLMIEAGH
jgi:phage shock protein A